MSDFSIDFAPPHTVARKPRLADPRPPQPPAPTMTTTLPRAHNLVVWYYSGRVVTTSHATKELAMDALERTAKEEWATAYKGVVMDGRTEVARRDIEVESTTALRELARWMEQHAATCVQARDT